MLVTDLYTAVEDIIGDPQALRTGLMLRVANRKLQELCRRFKCKFMLRSGTITTGATVSTTHRARSSNVVTLTTAAHGLVVGDRVVISDMTDSTYDGTYTVVTVADTTHLTYACTGTNETTTADTAGLLYKLNDEYNMPTDYYKPQIVYEKENDNWLRHITYKELKQRYPDRTSITEDVPTHYAPKKVVWVDAQNRAASKVAYSATETITLRIKGLVSGLVKSEDLSCTSGGSNSSANTYDAGGLISITAATAPTAAITCTTDSGTVIVLSLAIGQKTKQITRTILYPTPDDVYTMYLDYYAMHEELTNTNDNIMIPKPYEEWLIYTTSAEVLKIDGRKEANEYLQLGQVVFDQMVVDEMIEPDEKWTSWPTDYPEEYEF